MLNKVIMMGRLTSDPTVKTTPNGVPVATFNLAVDRDYTPKDGGDRKADFFHVSAWRKTAEFVEKYFSKGQLVAVAGRLQTSTWETSNGEPRTMVEIVAESVYFGGSKKDNGPQDAYARQDPPKVEYVPFPEFEDDVQLPF